MTDFSRMSERADGICSYHKASKLDLERVEFTRVDMIGRTAECDLWPGIMFLMSVFNCTSVLVRMKMELSLCNPEKQVEIRSVLCFLLF